MRQELILSWEDNDIKPLDLEAKREILDTILLEYKPSLNEAIEKLREVDKKTEGSYPPLWENSLVKDILLSTDYEAGLNTLLDNMRQRVNTSRFNNTILLETYIKNALDHIIEKIDEIYKQYDDPDLLAMKE